MVAINQERIFSPPSPRIFVFGSNLRGLHGKGAALHASKYYGAEPGIAIGHINQCYAIPTKDQMLRPLRLEQVQHFISSFVAYANSHLNFQFNVTQIGCGYAKFTPKQIVPSFDKAPDNCWFDPHWDGFFLQPKKYWSQPI